MNITVTLIGQMVAFILLIWFVNKVNWTELNRILSKHLSCTARSVIPIQKALPCRAWL